MHLLFITTSNLTTNPRLVKEIKLAHKHNIKSTVISFDFGGWSTSIDKELKSNLSDIDFRIITDSRKELFQWIVATSVFYFSKILYWLVPSSIFAAGLSSDKRCSMLIKQLLKVDAKFDLVVAHNLGTLLPAALFSRRHNLPFAFDLEDYHPGEAYAMNSLFERDRRISLMKLLLPKAWYISFASPLIGKYTLDLIPELDSKRLFLVNNSFPANEFAEPSISADDKIAFVWFSQNIAQGRGLELVLPVLSQYNQEVSLTLIGNLDKQFYNDFLKKYDGFVTYMRPLSQPGLHATLKDYEVGLAIELSTTDENREICLTNKIFAYAQAGLYILATDTKAQIDFFKNKCTLGKTFSQSSKSFEEALLSLIQRKREMRQLKDFRYKFGCDLAWEKESEKLLNRWKMI